MPDPTLKRRLTAAKLAQVRLNNAEDKATDAAKILDGAVSAARLAGATYAQIQEVTGLGTTRVTTILRRHRSNSWGRPGIFRDEGRRVLGFSPGLANGTRTAPG